MFEPSIVVFDSGPLDKFLRGTCFAYVDIIDTLGVMHLPVFDYYGARIKVKTILTNRDFSHKNRQVAIVFARTRNDTRTIRKAVKEVYKQVCTSEAELIDLYVRAHDEGFFADLHGLRL
jgi:hypothetical protein